MSGENGLHKIVIIGGGFSGTMVAVNLLRLCPPGTEIVVIEKRDKLGLGLAYSTTCDEHLLNVRALGMSAFPGRPMHFFDYAHELDPSITPQTFVPRKIYGRYLQSVLEQSVLEAQARGVTFCRITGEAMDLVVDASGGTMTVVAEGGVDLKADFVVLALGNMRSALPKIIAPELETSGTYLHDPWLAEEIAAIRPDASVLLIGTGLTAVDKILELAHQGHKGNVIAVSRHGLFPQRHLESASRERSELEMPQGILPACRLVRQRAYAANDWRTIIDGLRPLTQDFWKTLSEKEKKIFLRHLQTYWDVHRHRMAPEIAAKLEALTAGGQLSLVAGRIMEISAAAKRSVVKVRLRKSGETKQFEVDKIINCTGPEIKLGVVKSRLLQNMAKRGLARSHALGFGLDLDAQGRFLDPSGNALLGIHALGPVLKPQLFETVAVPELRVQAKRVADTIVGHLIKRNSGS